MRLTKVVSFCLGDIPSARIGIVEPMLELQKEGKIDFSFYLAAELTREILADADIIISIRSADSYELNIVNECKKAGKLIIYYLDDDLLNIPLNAASSEYFNSELVKNNIVSIIGQCDYLLTNNVRIKEKYQKYVQKGAYIIKAPALLLKSIKPKETSGISKPVIKIGFSGGTDHKANLETLLKYPLYQLKSKYGDKIEFEFMGAKPDFGGDFEYRYIPYQSEYDNYISQMSKIDWDIGVAPLPDSDFHACKYYNKFLEYGAINAAGIYSDVDPYKQIIRNEINGLLVENTEDSWIAGLSTLIENEELRLKVSSSARIQLEKEFTTQCIAKDIETKLGELTLYKAPYCKPSKLNLFLGSKVLITSKLYNIVKSMGLRAPLYIAKKSLSETG
ncbi:glycosyltransferase [Paenibacillus sp. DMB20]|uniref:glycosyltransferase n=1 Tax=Paenibacillus sp. DMB20 TaxID=1642570 RepID=UPI000627A164|nr:glycosyltransferase [Paenibacillus sp. DMB20]KKO54766.1 hypothetical protein XI25_04565 [Paenibacillus sp. DMB20]